MAQRPLVELLTSSKFPELAAALRSRSAHLIDEWAAMVREVLPIADRLTFEQLRDDMPEVLEKMACSLESDRPSRVDELLDIVPKHGEVRFHQSFSLAEVLVEYNLLRAVVIEQVITHLGRKIEADEVVALSGALDLAGQRAVLAFSRHQSSQLQAATEAQSKYLSFLSHDLRGGLNGVFLMIEVLKRELANQPQLAETVKDLDSMRRALLETVGTMDRFLHAERFRKGKVQLKPGRIHLKHLINETVSHFSYQAREKGLQLHVEAPDDCVITSDRELLSLIFQNLISNAVKYTPSGAVDVAAQTRDDGTCLVTVKDQGPGIAPERLSELFSAFTRGETHGQPGVGLGLAIAQQAAQYLGVKLRADSMPGEGSTFHVEIPKSLPEQAVQR
jgi:signal transduction histidine kinase